MNSGNKQNANNINTILFNIEELNSQTRKLTSKLNSLTLNPANGDRITGLYCLIIHGRDRGFNPYQITEIGIFVQDVIFAWIVPYLGPYRCGCGPSLQIVSIPKRGPQIKPIKTRLNRPLTAPKGFPYIVPI